MATQIHSLENFEFSTREGAEMFLRVNDFACPNGICWYREEANGITVGNIAERIEDGKFKVIRTQFIR